LYFLLESIDIYARPASFGNLFVNVKTGVQAADSRSSRNVRTQWYNGHDPRRTILAIENICSLRVLVVLVYAHLLRSVAAVEFGHDLLVWCLSASSFNALYFPCKIVSERKLGISKVDTPLESSLSAPLDACRDLKDFCGCLVVLRW
jgi:hypothetical protein